MPHTRFVARVLFAFTVLASVSTATVPRAVAQATVSFVSAGQVRQEEGGAFAITVQLDQASAVDVQVPFTLGGTATLGSDYQVPGSPLTIPAGLLQANLVVTPFDDPLAETVETIVCVLGAPSSGTLGLLREHLVVLAPSDQPLGGKHPRATITLPLRLEPTTLDFGALRLGTTSGPLPLVVTNTTNQALALTAADLLGRAAGDFVLTPAAPLPLLLAPGESTTLHVIFTPSVTGLRQADVRLQQLPFSILPLAAPVLGVGLGPVGAELLVNCAGQKYLGENGELWSADFGHHGVSWTYLYSGAAALSAPADTQLYRSTRLGANFGYAFELEAGTYEVSLHAIELWKQAPGQRRFDVTLEGQPFLDDLDLFAAVGKNTAFIARQQVTVSDGRLDIDLVGGLDEAVVSAIEVRSVGVLSASPATLDFGVIDVGQSLSLDLMLQNVGLAPLHADTLGFRILAGDASEFSAELAGTSYPGGSSEVSHPIDLTLASGASVVVPVTFAPLEHGQHSIELFLRGDFAELAVDLDGRSGVGGDPYLHPVLVIEPVVVDYDEDLSEPVLLDGSDSHTHEPGHALVGWEWRVAGQLVSTLEVDTRAFPVGHHSVELEIRDDNSPAHTLADSADFQVAPVSAVPGVLALYYAASPPGTPASALLDSVPALPTFAETLPDFALPAGAALGASGLAGHAMVRLRAGFEALPGTYELLPSGGVDRRMFVDGAPITGPKVLAAGPHELEVRWAVDTLANLPLQIAFRINGGMVQSFVASELVHDPRDTPPLIHSMPGAGVTGGGNQIVITGFGFFPRDQVTVHWGTTDLGSAAFSAWSAGLIEFLSPPGSAGTIQVRIETPAGLSNARNFEYQSNGPVPIAFLAGPKPTMPDPTAAEWGPDGRLYVVSRDGTLRAVTFADDYTVSAIDTYPGVSMLSNHEAMGLAFDPFDAPSPVKVYVAHSEMYAQGGGAFVGSSPYTGQVSLLTGPSFATPVPVITLLPTSNHDHGVNGMVFDHDGDLLFGVGGNTNAGVRHPAMGDLPESPLAGAILEARLSLGPAFVGDLLYLETATGLANNDQVHGESVDLAPGRHVEVFASGLRNTFDLVLTTWGSLYAADNGPNNTFGVASLGPTSQSTWHAHDWDELNLIEYGHYYGHPNRNRGRYRALENVYLDTDAPAEPGFTPELCTLSSSVNGIVEYRAATFGGQLRGDLTAAKFGEVLKRIVLSADKRSVVSVASLIPDSKGLGVTAGPGGALILADYSGDKLRVYTPSDAAASGLTVYDITPWRAPQGGPGGGAPFVIGGQGFGTLANTSVTIGGAAAALTAVSPTRIRGKWPTLPGAPSELVDVVVTVAGTTRVLAKAALFLPAARGQWLGAWSAGPAMPNALGEVASGVIDGKLYVVGEGSDKTLAFDIASQTWNNTLGKRPFKGHHHAAEVWHDKWYLIGGLNNSSPGKVQVYDPQTNLWTLGAPMPWSAGSVSTCLIGGKIYAAGGIVGTTTVDDCAVYDIAADTWTPLASMPAGKGRNHAAAATDGQRFYVFGGRGVGSGAGNVVANGFADVQVYDPATNLWSASFDPGSPLVPLPIGRGGMGKAAYFQGRFLVFGGETLTGAGAKPGNVYDRVDVYDPVTNQWSLEAALPTPRHGLCPVIWEDKIYLPGGGLAAGFSSSSVLEVFVGR